MKRGSILIAGLMLSGAAHAQSWSWNGTGVAIPASVAGAKIAGATLNCADGAFALTLQGVTIGNGQAETPIAIMIDQSVFATTASSAGEIAIPQGAVDALKSGSRMTLSFPAAGMSIETAFSLRGSSKALDQLAQNCRSTPKPEAAPANAAAAVEMGATLDAAATVAVQQPLQVSFAGPAGKDDWIGLALVGSSDSSWVQGAYFYVAKGSPQTITAPVAYGPYELRYVTGEGKVLTSKTIEVTKARDPYVDAPDTAAGGALLRLDFAGPNGANAFVGIAREGDAAGIASVRADVHTSPAYLRAPVQDGGYQLRYVDNAGAVVATKALTVTPPPLVTLAALESAPGVEIAVNLPDAPRWSGDYIYIAPAGTGDADYSGGYVGVPSTGPATIKAPAQAGEWEIRYVVPSDGSYAALGRARLVVK